MVDRNQAAKDREQAQRELGQQLQKFARLLNEGKTGMIDRFGVKLGVGAYVVYAPPHDLIFEVLDVAPVLDMSRPAGYIKLKLVAETTIEFIAGQRAMNVIKCGEKAAEGEVAIQPPGSVPPEDQPADQGPSEAEAAAMDPPPVLPPADADEENPRS